MSNHSRQRSKIWNSFGRNVPLAPQVPQDLLESVTRIISDRSVSALFFKNYHLMDYELMGGDGREVILAQGKQRGITPTLPPAVPFGSRQFPTLISGGAGPTSLVELH